MMYHHDSRDYEFAKSQAAKSMRDKLHKTIAEAREQSLQAIERIQNEVLQDRIVRTQGLEFDTDLSGQLVVQYKQNQGSITRAVEEHVHPWALGQIAEYAHVPRAFLSHLQGLADTKNNEYWGGKLAAHNLNELFRHTTDKRLTRSVENQTRGFLSTKYKRRHPGQLLDGFMNACKQNDMIPYRADKTDTKHMVRAVLDGIFEPIKDECLGIGVVYSESPVGNGATSLSVIINRMWCTNEAVMQTELRSLHIGGRLSEDFEWSEETYLADTKATVHQIGDMMRSYVSPEALAKLGDTIKLAHETKIEPKQLEAFLKKSLSKEDAEAVSEKYRSADVEMLPAGNTVWRASNALSWFANTPGMDAEKRYDMQKLAGQLLEPMSKVVEKRGKA